MKPEHNTPCLFKCQDYTTEIVGRYHAEKDCFYVERGDGTRYYYDFNIEWYAVLSYKAKKIKL